MKTSFIVLLAAALTLCCASPRPVVRETEEKPSSPSIRAEEKANGLLLIITADRQYSDIRCWYEENGIFSVTLYPASVIPEFSGEISESGMLTGYDPVSLPESVQLSFAIRYAVTSWNVYQDETTHTVFLSLFLDRSTVISSG